jgi:hypothetical protein
MLPTTAASVIAKIANLDDTSRDEFTPHIVPDASARGSAIGRGKLVTVPAKKPESWTIRHFSQANPEGEQQADVPALLRRVADSIETFGDIEVYDITFHSEITADGPWTSLTVYFDDKG